VDYPNSTKKRKMYLCLMVGHQEVPSGLTEGMEVDDSSSLKVKNEKRRKARMMASKKTKGKRTLGSVDKDWILKKKELYRQRKGVEQVPRDSKASLDLACVPVAHPSLIISVSNS
jgi:18S rRNA (guanine1575-N7)-methyltransferase